MFLPKDSLVHVNAIAHEGKVVAVATDSSGSLFYSVKQDGFEDSYLSTPPDQRTGWEPWQALELPAEPDDESVVEKEKAELTYKATPDVFIVRSRYRTVDETAVAPVQLVSGPGHLYVFRQSRSGTLLVDRFVLDGLTNRLTRKLEVRFKRSRQRNKPIASQRQTPSGLQNIDSLDFRDSTGAFFYEPTTELALINNVVSGFFAVVLVPTSEHEKYRWHIFLGDSPKAMVQLISVRASDDGLFDVKDYTVFEPGLSGALVPRSIPGIIRRTLDLGVMNVLGVAATKYDLQQEQAIANSDKTQLIKTATRLMLLIPVGGGTAALSFAIAGDGTLAQLSESPQNQLLRSKERMILLPLNTLDAIKPIADSTPPAHGVVRGVQRGTAEQDAEDQVLVASDEAAALTDGDTVEIKGTAHYNGLYQVSNVSGDTFTIEAKWSNSELGFWEKQDEEGGLVFDGLLTAYEKTADGKLRVTARAHGLTDGDQVQLVGTVNQNGVYPIRKLDDTQFVIERRWTPGEAVNVKAESRKRRGLVLDGQDDYVDLPVAALPVGDEISITFWAKGGSTLPKDTAILEGVDKNNNRQLMIHLPWLDSNIYFDCGNDGVTNVDRVVKSAAAAEYQGEWTHWAFTKDAAAGETKIYRNGTLWHSATGTFKKLLEVERLRLGSFAYEGRGYYEGTLAELSIWKRVLGEDEIRNGMFLTLTGREIGLVSYYRLGAVVEGESRMVIDSALGGHNGVVHGGAYAGSVTLARTLRDGVTPAVKYENAEMVAVTQRATYIEDFEFRVHRSAAADLALLNNADGTGNKIFTLSYWGRSSRSAEEKLAIAATPDDFVDLGGGWFRASCRFTVPDGVALLRSFGISAVSGTWDALEIRKQRLRMISDAIGEVRYTDRVSLPALADPYGAIAGQVADMTTKEQQEAELRQEQRELETKLAALEKRAALQRRRQLLVAELQRLQSTESSLRSHYDSEVNNPLNYWCYITQPNRQGKRITYEGPDLALQPAATKSEQLFRFRLTGDRGTYYIHSAYYREGYSLTLYKLGPNYYPTFAVHGSGSSYLWKLVPLTGGAYMILNDSVSDSLHLAVVGDDREPHGFMVPNDRGDSQRFLFTRTNELADDGRIAALKQDWDSKREQLTDRQAELSALDALLSIDPAQQSGLAARLATVRELLAQLGGQLNGINSSLLQAINAIQNTAQAMPIVATDSRQLSIYGALLPFVRPTSRIQALETSEGNVQLCYFDQRGCIRQTVYDATADSLNATFEQWIPDAQRACLNLDGSASFVELVKPLELPPQWSLEAFFSYPLPDKTWNTLSSSVNDSEQQLTVFAGRHLGARYGGYFLNSGYVLDGLAAGWHHIGVVKQEDDQGIASFAFYIDGAKVGQAAPPAAALALDGKDDSVELPGVSIPQGQQLTIAFWARDAVDAVDNACLLEAVDAHDQRLLAIMLPGYGGRVTFECGQDTRGIDRVQVKGPLADLLQPWTHWVFTKSQATATMQIFRNGALFGTAAQKRRPLAAAAKVVLGRRAANSDSYYKGQLAELSTWDRELDEEQIRDLYGRQLTGSEDGLVSYWKFGKDKAVEVSGTQRSGTYTGAPQLGSILSSSPGQIAGIGNVINVATHEVTTTIPAPSQLLDGAADYIELPAACLPTGTQLSISFWARGGSQLPTANSVISAADASGRRLLNIHLPWTDRNVYFDCGKGYDRIQKLAAPALYQGTFTHWVFTKNVTSGEMAIYCNGALWHSATGKSAPLAPAASLLVGRLHDVEGNAYYPGEIAELAIWNRVLSGSEVQTLLTQAQTGREPGVVGYWRLDGKSATDYGLKGLHGTLHGLMRPGGTIPLSGTMLVGDEGSRFGKLAEVRIWGTALTGDEMAINSKTLLSGNEPGLVAYYPLNEGSDTLVRDYSGNSNFGLARGATWWACTAPIGALRDGLPAPDAVVGAEYATVAVDPLTQAKVSIMRRMLAAPGPSGAHLLSDKRIELLSLTWVGNGQFAPTLLGYIEGSPPVPSENLTGDINYNGATSVELKVSEDVEFRWSRSQESGLGASLDTFLGVDTQTYAGLGVATKAADVRAGFRGNFNTSNTQQNESNITTTASQYMVDRLELRGSPEVTAKFPQFGVRFVPKNVGYALVISSLADIFIIKLARSGRMVGYQVSPVDGIPPDINTITFLMNPAYVMQGSLDGLTGTSATSERFFKQVPELRAQYGSLYPASYYRLQEAYDLKQQIDNDDKRRESYFAQFSVSSTDQDAVAQAIASGPAPAQISVNRQEDKSDQMLSEEDQKAADKARGDRLKKEAAASADQQSEAVTKRQKQIEQQIADENQRAHATASFASWQQKMEDIALRAGKRNIVNTYVWDADGGLRTESQSFASTAEHTIGGSFSLDAGLGGEGQFGAFGAKVELTALATIRMAQSLSKTQSTSRGIELNVDLSGVESAGVTDHNDNPLLPGEKVQRYRMMSFYLENSTRNFYDFFTSVVDPEWLRSNGEEARALRQAMGKANKTWRVLHRVTYVERPALLNFGRDLRTVPGQSGAAADKPDRATQEILAYFQNLEEKHKALQTRFIQLQDQQQVMQDQQRAMQDQLQQIISLLKK